MFIYFFLLFLTFILYKNDKYNKSYAFIILSLLFILTALRDPSIGIDTESYMAKYKYRSNEYTAELLFDSTYTLIHSIGGSSQLWLAFVSLLMYIPYTYVICKYSKVPMLSVLIFITSSNLFFFDGMNGIRQWIAGGIILLSFVLRSEGKFLSSLICFAFSIGFHLSSIIALPFLLLPSFNLRKWLSLSLLAVFIVLGLFASHLNISQIFDSYRVLINGYDGFGADKLSAYGNYDEIENTTNLMFYLVNIVPIALMCMTSYVPYKSSENGAIFKKKNDEHYLYIIFFIGTIFHIFCSTSIAYGHRLMYALLTTQLICLPNAYKNGSKRQKQIISIVVLYFIVWFIYYVIKTNGSRVGSTIPYSFFF